MFLYEKNTYLIIRIFNNYAFFEILYVSIKITDSSSVGSTYTGTFEAAVVAIPLFLDLNLAISSFAASSKIIPNGFICGIGTGGTLIGIGKKLKEQNPDTKIYALEPTNMSLIKKGTIGNHKIEGIGDEFIPDLVDLNMIDDIILIDDDEAIMMAQKLATELGIGVGISSGANMLACILMHEEVDGNIVTVFPDDLKKYITTDLTKKTNNLNSIANQIKLLDYEIL